MSSLTVADLKGIHPLFDDDVAGVWSYEASVEKKKSAGGTSRSAVLGQIENIRTYLSSVVVP